MRLPTKSKVEQIEAKKNKEKKKEERDYSFKYEKFLNKNYDKDNGMSIPSTRLDLVQISIGTIRRSRVEQLWLGDCSVAISDNWIGVVLRMLAAAIDIDGITFVQSTLAKYIINIKLSSTDYEEVGKKREVYKLYDTGIYAVCDLSDSDILKAIAVIAGVLLSVNPYDISFSVESTSEDEGSTFWMNDKNAAELDEETQNAMMMQMELMQMQREKEMQDVPH